MSTEQTSADQGNQFFFFLRKSDEAGLAMIGPDIDKIGFIVDLHCAEQVAQAEV